MKRRRWSQWLNQRHFGETLGDYKGVQLIFYVSSVQLACNDGLHPNLVNGLIQFLTGTHLAGGLCDSVEWSMALWGGVLEPS